MDCQKLTEVHWEHTFNDNCILLLLKEYAMDKD